MFLVFNEAKVTKSMTDEKEDTFRASGGFNAQQTKAMLLLVEQLIP